MGTLLSAYKGERSSCRQGTCWLLLVAQHVDYSWPQPGTFKCASVLRNENRHGSCHVPTCMPCSHDNNVVSVLGGIVQATGGCQHCWAAVTGANMAAAAAAAVRCGRAICRVWAACSGLRVTEDHVGQQDAKCAGLGGAGNIQALRGQEPPMCCVLHKATAVQSCMAHERRVELQ